MTEQFLEQFTLTMRAAFMAGYNQHCMEAEARPDTDWLTAIADQWVGSIMSEQRQMAADKAAEDVLAVASYPKLLS